jgi:hypothetical protein
MNTAPALWPSLAYGEWAETKKTVQLYAQILGKTRLSLAPPQPEWLGSNLEARACGLSTGAMPWGTTSVEVSLDFVAHELCVDTSDGKTARVPLVPAKSVATVYRVMRDIYAEFGIDVDVWDKPQELEDTTPLSADEEHRSYDPEAVERWWSVVSAVRGVFEEWRSPFFGRTAIAFWWGAFDLAVMRFSGNHAAAPDDRGYIMRYDLDAEFMNAGFWPGDDSSPHPVFYAYLHPKPEGCELAAINPSSAAWIEQMGEWVLPYDEALASGDPRQCILGFLDSVYAVAGSHGGWELERFTYTVPAPPKRA